ncbi:Uncharacterised protein [Vibrio cholerae]|uniref:Uncharacterized protein n=1 Tax=Vibrio cholerae TaxID=666 RepID=A0A655X3J1_VIBCL|nr:Uncharacterised protein [Vibrio cholerae]
MWHLLIHHPKLQRAQNSSHHFPLSLRGRVWFPDRHAVVYLLQPVRSPLTHNHYRHLPCPEYQDQPYLRRQIAHRIYGLTRQ